MLGDINIQGDPEAMEELAKELESNGFACSKYKRALLSAIPSETTSIILGITGNAVAITTAILHFLSKRPKYRITIEDETGRVDLQGYPPEAASRILKIGISYLERSTPDKPNPD
jgi:hypothetical protein